MKAVVMRVTEARVEVDGAVAGQIGPGLLVLVAATHDDTPQVAQRLADKVAGLRILRDGDRDEASAVESCAPVLVVSQFTLYGDTRKGRRPSWSAAAPAAVAEPLVDEVVAALRRMGLTVATGVFGAMMSVISTNDGPFTVVVEA